MMSSRLKILYQDDDMIAVNKPSGLLVESFEGGEESLQSILSESLGREAHPFHRLDRLTTGVTLFGKTARLNKDMSRLFAQKRIRKEYWAIVDGIWPKDLGRVETHIRSRGNGVWENAEESGKPAITTFRVNSYGVAKTWIQALPKTGRTHQIRLHCQFAGYPILGDTLYGSGAAGEALALHARSVLFKHPLSGMDLRIEAETPKDWSSRLEGVA